MQTANLTAVPRSRGRKSELKTGRRDGMVPVVLYGSGNEAELLNIHTDTLLPVMKMGHGTTLLIDLSVEGQSGGAIKTVIRDVQRNPVTREVIHCDLLKVDMNRKYQVTVPVVLEGESVGVRTFGGILQAAQREVEILCLPGEIPESYVIDISELGIGDTIKVEDIPKLGDEEFITPGESPVATVTLPRMEEEPEKGEAEELAEGEEAEEGEDGEKKAEGSDEEKGEES